MPKGYIVAELTIDNPGAEISEYRGKVLATVEAYGGRFLVRGGQPAQIEGESPHNTSVILEFESPGQAMAWYNSPEYQRILPLRTQNATSRVLCATGT